MLTLTASRAQLRDGLRILELGSSLAVAFCGLQFARWGADVVAGDTMHGVPPLVDGASLTQAYLTANKRITRSPADFLSQADVILTDQPLESAENGVVGYAGNALRGFGNLVLIKHADGWVSAYAHHERLLVKRGDKVKKGQRIGTVGSTGNVTTPQLHFELRKGRRARDPRKHLRRV